MPLLKEINHHHFKLALWHINESAEFFLNKMSADSVSPQLLNITNAQKQLEFLSSRYLIQHIEGIEALQHLQKLPSGKPFLENLNKSVSISHSSTHAAVLVSQTERCGIDIEAINPRVKKVTSRFLSEEERNLASPSAETELFTLFWSAKETVFKWYSEGNLSFRKQIVLQPGFVFSEKGQMHYKLLLPDAVFDIMVQYEVINNNILTYAIE
jgi:phosphopantetheinyl transferase